MFTYPDLAEGHVRFVRVQSTQSPIRCEIKDFSLHSSPEYFALSYAWGTDAPTKTILCNDEPFTVQPNLYSALEQLGMKPELEDAWLWIDAICINQKNDGEKNVQVRKMAEVYSSALKVLVWLGPAADDSDPAMDNIRNIVEAIGPVPMNIRAREAAQARLPPREHPVWRALVKLYQRPWFRRLWIVQEAVLAKEMLALCGNRTLTWSFMVAFAEAISLTYPAIVLHNGQLSDETVQSGFAPIRQIKTWRELLPTNDLTLFSTILEIARRREVSNPLDRIYGLLALMPPNVRNAVVVDYTWDFCDGYIQFCKWFIEHEHSLSLLSMAPSAEKPAQLPSWCPNFHSPYTEGLQYSLHVGFNAGFKDWINKRSAIKSSDEDNSIRVPGFRVDTVRTVAQRRFATPPSYSSADILSAGAKNLEWDTECLQLFHQVSSDDLETYARVLIANHFKAAEPVPASMPLSPDYLGMKGFWTWQSRQTDLTQLYQISTHAAKESQIKYADALHVHNCRRFINNEGGRVGLGPSQVQPGDVVCVFYDGGPLFVLRFEADARAAKLVGDAFVDGLMNLATIPAQAKQEDEEFLVV